MKTLSIVLLCILPICSIAQVNELNFNYQNISYSTPPRTSLSPMSIKLWDSYNVGGPSTYGTVMEIYGLSSHQTSQLHFGGWDNSRIRYREAFYAQNTWSDWVTLLDSKNNITSSGTLQVSGSGSHYISEGSFGIGTSTPAFKFDTDDNSNTWSGRVLNRANNAAVYFSHGQGYGMHINVGSNASTSTYAMQIFDPNLGDLFYIRGDGNVGVGTGNPTEKLAVNGNIRSRQVKVESTNWPDYVFDEQYVLPDLDNVESQIKELGHLPGIPSAAEVQQSGLDLGDMNERLLKKIEELTLYLIEQNKELKALKLIVHGMAETKSDQH